MFVAQVVVALLAMASGLGVILSPQAVHSALFLTLNLLCVAVLYLTMSLQFLGAAQLVVYAGAIMVVFLFAVTVLAPEDEMKARWSDPTRIAGLLVAALFGGAISAVLSTASVHPAPPMAFNGTLQHFAINLFGKYVFAFENTAFILLVALIGVVLLGHRRLRGLDRPQRSELMTDPTGVSGTVSHE
jgi:NADH-quinone oxidoreductase subunit J